MIKLEKVNKYFYRHKRNQIHVINNTSLELGDTGLVALLGPSGCGKTTLLNTIGGLDKVNSGKIFINGKRITKRRSGYIDKIRNLNIGYIFQDYYLVDNMSVFDNIALVLKINGMKNKEEIKKRVNFVLEKVGMYRYRNRYTSMLSGGERQRVGIARAIVKDPSIIIADEPTGNLDSRNTLEVMNIIKAISKSRLVILVTHETEIADFYATRILDIKDGSIENDRINEHADELDYKLDSNIYLKDFPHHDSLSKENINIDYYSDAREKLDIDIVVQNGNIYVKTKKLEKIEIVDDNSSIEFVNDHYKKINKTIYEEYNFDFDKLDSKNYKKRYSSIFNPITLLINGFRKIRDYSTVKKVLLLGFFITGIFITNAISNALGVSTIEDKDFISVNRNYLNIVIPKLDVIDYLNYEKNDTVDYMIPGDSHVSFMLKHDDYFQTVEQITSISGSLTDISKLTEKDIINGTYPKNRNEIVLDRFVVDRLFNNSGIKQAGILSENDLLGRELYIDNMKPFIIVGITDKKDPSIYADKNDFINILYYTGQGDIYSYGEISKVDRDINRLESYMDYTLLQDKCTLVKGRWPSNPYEVVINFSYKDQYKINKYMIEKLNGNRLKVVGYYTSTSVFEKILVSNDTIKLDLIVNSSNITIYPKDKEQTITSFAEMNINVEDTYQRDKIKHENNIHDLVITCILGCAITLLISMIEIYLMIRSSFLSRIKEVGIYRAIGMRKRDIRKMFLGEIIAITSVASLPGVLLMTYILKQLTKISYYQQNNIITLPLVGCIILFVYLFNIIVGLLPVNRVLRQTPAKILSRSDLE